MPLLFHPPDAQEVKCLGSEAVTFDLEARQVFGDPQFLRKRPSRAFALATSTRRPSGNDLSVAHRQHLMAAQERIQLSLGLFSALNRYGEESECHTMSICTHCSV